MNKFFKVVFAALLLLHLPSVLLAVSALEQAERLQLVYAHLLDLRSNSAPIPQKFGSFEISGELQPMPSVDTRIGAKTEPLDKLPASGRLRFRGFILDGLMLGITGVPGLTVGQQKATALQGELGWRADWGLLQTGLRYSLSSWKVEGPMTTSEYTDILRNRQQNYDLTLGSVWENYYPYLGYGNGTLNSDLWIEESLITLSIKNHHYSYQFIGMEMSWQNWNFNYEQHKTEDFLYHFNLSAILKF